MSNIEKRLIGAREVIAHAVERGVSAKEIRLLLTYLEYLEEAVHKQ